MRQVAKNKSSKKSSSSSSKKSKNTTVAKKKVSSPKKRWHPAYGTSKLEDKFATEFLDKLGVEYEKQFKAEDIGRYYDFYLPKWKLLIEVDGDYYHSKGLTYEQMSPMQKRNNRVDKLKNEWAILHGYKIIRVWESDINENSTKLLERLKEYLLIEDEKIKRKEIRKKRQGIRKEKKEEETKGDEV